MDASPTANYASLNAGTLQPQAPVPSNRAAAENRRADPASGYRFDKYPTASFFQFRSISQNMERNYRSEG